MFAYGQTGSGKTFTMEGGSDAIPYSGQTLSENSGLLPRLAFFIKDEVTEIKNLMKSEIKVEISAIENYCDQVRDLFSEFQTKEPASKQI